MSFLAGHLTLAPHKGEPLGPSGLGARRDPLGKPRFSLRVQGLGMSGTEQSFPDLDDAQKRQWEQIRSHLRAELGEELYDSWFRRLEPHSADDGLVMLITPTNFVKTWIEHHHMDRLEAAFQAELGGIRRISLVARDSCFGANSPKADNSLIASIGDASSFEPDGVNTPH